MISAAPPRDEEEIMHNNAKDKSKSTLNETSEQRPAQMSASGKPVKQGLKLT